MLQGSIDTALSWIPGHLSLTDHVDLNPKVTQDIQQNDVPGKAMKRVPLSTPAQGELYTIASQVNLAYEATMLPSLQLFILSLQ